jgi:isopenicillin-N N-acyltransferase-like protein
MASDFEKIVLEGSPRERGLKYGEAAKEKIRQSVEIYKKLFKTYAKMEWDACKKKADLFLPSIERYCAVVTEEIEGIAQASGLTFEDVLTLNCRSEIMFNTAESCTAIGLMPDVTSNGKSYIAQTWDWLEPARGVSLVLEIRQPPHPTILSVVEAGMVGGKGLNSAGLGVCLNALSCAESSSGVPLHLLYRGILNSWKLSDAIDAIALPEKAGSGNFLIGTGGGEAVFVEYVPDDFDVVYAEDGWLAHTNHYLSPALAPKDKMKWICSDTFTRLGRARKLVKKNLGKLDVALIHQILSDHVNFPDSICRHVDPHDAETRRNCTIYSVVMDLRERTMYVSNQSPCQGELYPFTLVPGL